MINNEAFKQKTYRLFETFHPINGAIEVTRQCNASCDYCYLKHEPLQEELTLKNWKYIIDKLFDAGVFFLCITGGEPFIRADILSILEYCVKKDFFKISILTNGTMIHNEHISFLTRHRDYFSFVRMSVFSHINEIHDSYCGIEHSLKTLLRNAKTLRDNGVPVTLSLNLLDINYATFEETKKTFNNMGFTVQVGIPKLISSPELHEKLRPSMGKDFFHRFFSKANHEETIAYRQGLLNKMHEHTISGALCTGIFSNIFVNCQGEIAPCSSFRKLVLGSIFDSPTLPAILSDSPVYRKLRTMQKTDNPACRQCDYINYCKHCLGVIHTEYGDFNHAPEQFCNFNKALHEFVYEPNSAL